MADNPEPSPTHRVSKLAAPILAGVLILGAASCTKKDEGASTTGTTAAAGGSTTTKAGAGGAGGGGSTTSTADTGGSSDTTTAGSAQVNLKKTFWISGFKVTLGEVRFDEAKSTLVFAIEAENLMNGDSPIYSSYLLESEGAQIATGNLDDGKSVVSGQKIKGTITFHGMGKKGGTTYDPAKTTLVVGSGSESQVRVQIDGKGKEDKLNAPIDQDFKGEITLGAGLFTIEKTQIRYDNVPSGGTTASEGKVYLVMTGKWKNVSGESALYLTTDQITLKAADGEISTPDSFESQTSLVKTKEDDEMAIVYELDEDFAGEYTIEFTQPFGTDGEDVTESKTFTLKAAGDSEASDEKKDG